jgi:hypothetical protein
VRDSQRSGARVLVGVLVATSLLCTWWFVFSTDAQNAKAELRPANVATAVLDPASKVSELPEKRTGSTFAAAAANPNECTLWRALRDWAASDEVRQATEADMQKDAKEAVRAALMELRVMPDERSRALSLSLGFLLEGFNPEIAGQIDETLTTEQRAAKSVNTTKQVADYSSVAERLVDLAVNSTDAVVYAAAYLHCDRAAWLNAQAKTSCTRLSPAQWARLDPDNAAPWMYQAQMAAKTGDQAGVSEAVFRVSKARRITDHSHVAAQALMANLPENMPDEMLVAIGNLFLLGGHAGTFLPGYQLLAGHCSAARLAVPDGDANGRQLCSDIADMLSQRGTTVLEMSIGLGMAKRGAWSAQKLSLAQAQLEELMRVMDGHFNGEVSTDSNSCSALKKAAAYRRDWIALGEVGALRQRVGNLIPATR